MSSPSRTYPQTMHQEEFDIELRKVKLHVQHGIVLCHEISKKGIKVDKAKIDVVAKFPIPKCVKNIWSFLGHAEFYRRFIKDFSKIARPLTNLLAKNIPFIFNNRYLTTWEKLKMKLIDAPIIFPPEWSKPFEIMCDAFDFTIGVVLRQRKDNKQHVIYYSNRTLWTILQLRRNSWQYQKNFVHTYLGPKPQYSPTILYFNPNAQKGCEGPTHPLDPPPLRVWSRNSR